MHIFYSCLYNACPEIVAQICSDAVGWEAVFYRLILITTAYQAEIG